MTLVQVLEMPWLKALELEPRRIDLKTLLYHISMISPAFFMFDKKRSGFSSKSLHKHSKTDWSIGLLLSHISLDLWYASLVF